jgi:hypothetical protein
MRRLYIVPKSVWSGNIQVGTAQTDQGAAVAVMVKTVQIFHPLIGSHYLELPGDLLLLVTSFDHDERAEDIFHSHPEVAILPHPTLDGNLPLKSHLGREGYKFSQAHLDALQGHALMGVSEADTVLDVFRKAAGIHPLMRLRNVL